MKTGTIFSAANHKIRPIDTVRERFPEATEVICAAFGVSHVFYADNTMNTPVAQTCYTNIEDKSSFIGVKLKFVWLKDNKVIYR